MAHPLNALSAGYILFYERAPASSAPNSHKEGVNGGTANSAFQQAYWCAYSSAPQPSSLSKACHCNSWLQKLVLDCNAVAVCAISGACSVTHQ